MPSMNNSYQADELTLTAFESRLAQYRGRVYETHFLGEKTRRERMNSEIFNQLDADKPTILIIEDNSDDYFMIRWSLLQRFPDVELVCVSNAGQVIPYLESCFKRETDLPKLILLDLYLPSAKVGLSVLQSLKSHQVYQQIPAIILSRSTDPEDMGNVLKYSGNSYIVKPAKPKEWLEAFTRLQAFWE